MKRVPREQFGVVGPFPLTIQDFQALVYPDATLHERKDLLEGLRFFTTSHTAAEGLGPINNQAFCLGCHMNTAEGVSRLTSSSDSTRTRLESCSQQFRA